MTSEINRCIKTPHCQALATSRSIQRRTKPPRYNPEHVNQRLNTHGIQRPASGPENRTKILLKTPVILERYLQHLVHMAYI